MGYSREAIKGTSWTAALRGSLRGITFVRTAILARILTPSQFGIFGIATLVLSFLEVLTETGINVFLIQEKKDLKEYVNDAWIVSICRGALLSILIVVLSPFIASFFNSPESQKIVMLIGIVPFIRGFINPSRVIFQKELQFDKEFLIQTSLFIIDTIVSIALVFMLHDVVGLAYGMATSAVAEVAISFLFINPKPKLSFDTTKMKTIFHSGKWVTASGIFSYIAENGDNIVVGRLLGTSPLGLYQVAYKFSTLPISEVTDVINKVTFPVYTRIADDKKRLLRAFIRTSTILTILVLISGGIIYVFAEPIITIILGPNWLPAVPAIKVLALYGILRAIFGSVSALFLSIKKQKYVTAMTFARFLGLAITIIPFTMSFGLVGAGYSALTSVIVELPVILYCTYKVFK